MLALKFSNFINTIFIKTNFYILIWTLNAADYRTRLKSQDQIKKLYKKVDILKIATKKPYMIANISMQKRIRIQNRFIIDHKIQNSNLL